jgi:hypothetical protein
MPKSVWRIEYTNYPFIKKKRRKILDRAVAEQIDDIERLLETEEDDALMLGETEFSVESTWLPDLKKYHIAVHDLKGGDEWVASIVFEEYPTMTVEEVKNTLRKMGFGEYSLYGLGMTNEKTVSEFLAELEEKLNNTDREEWAKSIDLLNLKFIEGFLEQGIIKLSDGLLDALRKIDRCINSGTQHIHE